jgi:hypothetical protein
MASRTTESVAVGLQPFANDRVPEGLTDLERTVVVIGHAEAFRRGWQASRPTSSFGRRVFDLMQWWDGRQRITPLANARLELLRLFACTLSRRDTRSSEIEHRLIALGTTLIAMREAKETVLDLSRPNGD